MEDYIYKIREYLPIRFVDADANEFLKYLEESYIENIKNQKYQIAFIAFHMLYMTFIYKVKWLLKKQGNVTINQILNEYSRQNRGVAFNTLFDLSQFNEKQSLERLLEYFKFHINEIRTCKYHVDVRNNCCHASGKIYYKKFSRVEPYIEEEIELVEKIHKKTINDFKKLLDEFLEHSWSRKLITGDIKNWFEENNISQKDLEIIVNFDLPLFRKKSDNAKNIFQKVLYLKLIDEAQKYIETEKNMFLEKLPIFMYGITAEVKIGETDEERTEPVQKIIDENLLPIINNLIKEDQKKAESIIKILS